MDPRTRRARAVLRPSGAHRLRGLAATLAGACSPAVQTATIALLCVRLPILMVGYLAVSFVGFAEPIDFRVSADTFWNLPARWDAGWYLGIATGGYRWSSNLQYQQNIAFFPAYPLLMRALGWALVSGPWTDPQDPMALHRYTLQAGLWISLAAFWWACLYLHWLARLEAVGREAASAAVLLLATYPFAVFYGAVYTESLFLLGTVAAFYHVRRSEWVAGGLWGLLVGLTRPNGCLLSVPLGLLALGPWWTAGRRSRQSAGPVFKGLAAAAMPGIGMLLFTAYLYVLTGRPFAWSQAHAAWGRSYRGAVEQVIAWYRFVSASGLYHYSSTQPVDLLNVLALVLALVLLWPVTRRLGLVYGTLLGVSLVPPFLAGGSLSMGRLTSTLFPVFLVLGQLVPARHRVAWLVAFVLVQTLSAAAFFTWRPMF